MNVCLWDIAKPDNPLLRTFSNHTEFVLGLDFNLFNER